MPRRRERGVRVRPEAVEDRQGERGRLAGAGLGGGEDVPALPGSGGWPVPGRASARCSPPRRRCAGGPRRAPALRSARSFVFSGIDRCAAVGVCRGPARRPRGRGAEAAATAGRGRAYPTMEAWAHRARGRSTRRDGPASRIRCMNMRTTPGRRSGRAVAATRSRRSRRSASRPPACSRRSSSRWTAASASAIVPADAEVDLKAVADALGGRRAPSRRRPRPRRRRATCWAASARSGRAARCRRSLDASAAAHPTIHVSAGRRGLEIELAAGRPGRADARGPGAGRAAGLTAGRGAVSRRSPPARSTARTRRARRPATRPRR